MTLTTATLRMDTLPHAIANIESSLRAIREDKNFTGWERDHSVENHVAQLNDYKFFLKEAQDFMTAYNAEADAERAFEEAHPELQP